MGCLLERSDQEPESICYLIRTRICQQQTQGTLRTSFFEVRRHGMGVLEVTSRVRKDYWLMIGVPHKVWVIVRDH